jgi:hypothetical protein
MPLKEVILSSTLFLGEYAHPGQMVTFTCEAKDIGTAVLEWYSDEYIGSGGDVIEISRNDGNNQTRLGGNTVATRVSVNTYSGVTVIVSQLHIMTSEQIPTSSMTCATNGNGPRKVIPFTTTGMKSLIPCTCTPRWKGPRAPFEPSAPRLQCPGSRSATNLVNGQNAIVSRLITLVVTGCD